MAFVRREGGGGGGGAGAGGAGLGSAAGIGATVLAQLLSNEPNLIDEVIGSPSQIQQVPGVPAQSGVIAAPAMIAQNAAAFSAAPQLNALTAPAPIAQTAEAFANAPQLQVDAQRSEDPFVNATEAGVSTTEGGVVSGPIDPLINLSDVVLAVNIIRESQQEGSGVRNVGGGGLATIPEVPAVPPQSGVVASPVPIAQNATTFANAPELGVRAAGPVPSNPRAAASGQFGAGGAGPAATAEEEFQRSLQTANDFWTREHAIAMAKSGVPSTAAAPATTQPTS
jgi:hypothetical protein